MSRKPVVDVENPEWSEADFARAKGADSLPAHVLAAFPKTAVRVRGAQKADTKVPVSIRLDRTVVDYFKAQGPGWQGRINEALAGIVRRS
ncbi:BrnA antitoxin family protein [Caulobacter sp.]|uniref:BrnA antitoxin family protein n=1 Tax=Caulobacter sp. TaxID=78 RepID=UPI001B202FC0|nr:BrnA antitoxin family protein [Caulobacter sp.]